MGPFGTVVIGKRDTLNRRAVRVGEAPLTWPDQGTPERNWALNRLLLDSVLTAGGAIKDADAAAGRPRGHDGFLARERAHIRAAGFRLGAGGTWRRSAVPSLLALAPALLARARAAAATGATTFALPEAAPAALWITARVADPQVRQQAIRWFQRGTTYHDYVRLCARAVRAMDPTPAPAGSANGFGAKVAGELEPLLSLWPAALALPTTMPLSRGELVRLRAFPVHPLGLVDAPTWADGRWLSPSEYFCHDLDHARFKIREDLLLGGVTLPDAYQDGSTVEPRTGRHRTILPFAAGRPGVVDRLAGRRDSHLLERVSRLPERTRRAAELLLFEVVHEKSLPLERATLAHTCRQDGHLLKLHRKLTSDFFGVGRPPRDEVAALELARSALLELCL